MAKSFYFYDLETTGINPRNDRILQFAGQRTTMGLKPMGKPDNILVKLSDDVLPSPDAILVTGITPQITAAEGVTETKLVSYLVEKVFLPGTITVGFNSTRFDDEFIRFLFWRNFADAYEWQWKENRSRWDLLDVSRMVRALRPDGIKWPFASDGKPSNRLELLSSVNKLEHDNAHDALSDVQAMISLARLIATKQPKLFRYLLNIRDKKKVQALVESGQPLLYTSGRYPSEFEKTTIVTKVASDPERGSALVYDLRIDPTVFGKLSAEELAKRWQDWSPEAEYFPVKEMRYNRTPAVAPLNVLAKADEARLKLNMLSIESNNQKLKKIQKEFSEKLLAALALTRPKEQPGLVVDEQKVDEQLYDGFLGDSDRTKQRAVRAASGDELSGLNIDFGDDRLKVLMPLYKARNFPDKMSADEKTHWQAFRINKLIKSGQSKRFFARIEELLARPTISERDKNILGALEIYGQKTLPKT